MESSIPGRHHGVGMGGTSRRATSLGQWVITALVVLVITAAGAAVVGWVMADVEPRLPPIPKGHTSGTQTSSERADHSQLADAPTSTGAPSPTR